MFLSLVPYTPHAGSLWVRLLIVAGVLFAFSAELSAMVVQHSIPNAAGVLLATLIAASMGVAAVAALAYGLYTWKTDSTRRV